MTGALIIFYGGILLNVVTFWFLLVNIRALRRLQQRLLDGLLQLELLKKMEQARATQQDNHAPAMRS
jgi:hypothetical protein